MGRAQLMEHAARVNEEIRSGKIEAKEELFFELMAPVPHQHHAAMVMPSVSMWLRQGVTVSWI
ncbi:hypothetical protein ACFJIV_03200 [Mucilaginibacter sp. UC70_90]